MNRSVLATIFAGLLSCFVACSGSLPKDESKDISRSGNGRVLRQESKVDPPTPSTLVPKVKVAKLKIGGHTVSVEVADNASTRGRGLATRTSLAQDSGMIFVYREPGWRSYWMKNCLIDLDLAFLDAQRRIFQIVSLYAPAQDADDLAIPRAKSIQPARFVIELSKGWFAAHGIKVGTKVAFDDGLERVASALER